MLEAPPHPEDLAQPIRCISGRTVSTTHRCRLRPFPCSVSESTVANSLMPVCCDQELCSVYDDGEQEALRYKWIESEKAGHDLGEAAIRRWVQNHWWGYLRARWLEHLQGKRFWVELDRGDFGLLQRTFHDNTLLLDRILDRLKAGQENLDILTWAHHLGRRRWTR